MPYQREIHIIQGMRFQQKPTTHRNMTRLQEHFDDPDDALLELPEYEQYVELLRFITDPVEDADYDKLDAQELDKKHVEYILGNFLPNMMRIAIGLNNS